MTRRVTLIRVLLRACAVIGLVVANLSVPARAANPCEWCALIPPEFEEGCIKPPSGMPGVDDCHMDGNQCHEAGSYCEAL
jgi:hypothetical protein